MGITYREGDLSPHIEVFEEIYCNLTGTKHHFSPLDELDEQVWEVARESTKIPFFENIYQSLLLKEIVYCLENEGIEAECYINSINTDLYINGSGIYSLDDYYVATFKTPIEVDGEKALQMFCDAHDIDFSGDVDELCCECRQARVWVDADGGVVATFDFSRGYVSFVDEITNELMEAILERELIF